MPEGCEIGTSGWIYDHWAGAFYPDRLPQADWFACYAERFSTVEINYSFYRLPDEDVFDRWRDQAPHGFVYAVKANRFLTHQKRLKDCAEALERFVGRCRRLGPSLGPVLYQLPPRWKPNIDRLATFLALLPTDMAHAIEFRDSRWFIEPVRALLSAHNVAFCRHDHLDGGADCPDWSTGNIDYFRFHGSRRSADGGYTDVELDRHAKTLRRRLLDGRRVYAYFNNDAFARAPENALSLIARLQAAP
jgi:uncharacterized protein YecE (DUF72 family)